MTDTDTHKKHLQVLDQVLARLDKNHLKINLEKCVFGNKEVSYLGFTLTPEGIKLGKNKLKAIKDAKPPTDIICGPVQFLPDAHQGLCPDRRAVIQAHKEGFGLLCRRKL